MEDKKLLLLKSLKSNIEEIIPSLDIAQVEIYGEKREDSLEFLTDELIMTVLLLTNADDNLSIQELKFINDMRHVVYGYGIPDLKENDYFELCKRFLSSHNEKRMTIDHLPLCINLLVLYDKKHSTNFADKASVLFIQFAEALINIDKERHHIEEIIFLNFKETLEKRTP